MSITIDNYCTLYGLLKKEMYVETLKKVHATALENIRKKKQIRIAFQTALLATWIGDGLVRRFALDDRFDVTVVITWQANMDKVYAQRQLENHFTKSNIRYVLADGKVSPRDYDIIFYTSPYIFALDNWKALDITLSTLVCYIPYGFYAGRIQSIQFNQCIHNMVWKNYVATKAYIELAEKYCDIGSYSMVYAGYPKLDKLYTQEYVEPFVWKIVSPHSDVKKIIYAPHHSINDIPFLSTFPDNYNFMLDYAKSHQDTTSWVFKPHPLLKKSCVENGIFDSEDDYDNYCKAWDDLPNARFVDGEYMSIFSSSDAMIFDSVSFMSEYLYTHKPALFLKRNGATFNEYGEKLLECLYQVVGDDYDSIVFFIEDVIDSDPKYTERELFWEHFLNYYANNKMLAEEYIYMDIVNELYGCGC